MLIQVLQWLGGLGVAAGVVAFLFWVLKTALSAALKRDVDAYVEVLKADLQREALKAELSTKRTHEVYSELMEKLRLAEGAVSGLFFSSRVSRDCLDDLDDGDLAQREEKLSGNIGRARVLTVAMMNFIAVKDIFLSDTVHKLASSIHQKLWGIVVDLSTNQQAVQAGAQAAIPLFESARKAKSELPAMMEQLRMLMRQEMNPRPIVRQPWRLTRWFQSARGKWWPLRWLLFWRKETVHEHRSRDEVSLSDASASHQHAVGGEHG